MTQCVKNARYELVDKRKYRPYRSFIHIYLAKQLVKTLKVPNTNAFRRGLGYNMVDTFNSKQQLITEKVKEMFDGEDIQTYYQVPSLRYRTDMYFMNID